MSEDTAALVERVRNGLLVVRDGQVYPMTASLAALDSLTAALERAERDMQTLEDNRTTWMYRAQKAKLDWWATDGIHHVEAQAEARAQKAEAERDALQDLAEELRTRLLKAEAVVEVARVAEAELKSWLPSASSKKVQEGLAAALAALDEQVQA